MPKRWAQQIAKIAICWARFSERLAEKLAGRAIYLTRNVARCHQRKYFDGLEFDKIGPDEDGAELLSRVGTAGPVILKDLAQPCGRTGKLGNWDFHGPLAVMGRLNFTTVGRVSQMTAHGPRSNSASRYPVRGAWSGCQRTEKTQRSLVTPRLIIDLHEDSHFGETVRLYCFSYYACTAALSAAHNHWDAVIEKCTPELGTCNGGVHQSHELQARQRRRSCSS